MQRFMLHGTTHRATVTAADLHDVGSLTLDRDLVDDAAPVVPVVPSTRVPRFTAEIKPIGRAIRLDSSSAPTVSSTVAGSRSITIGRAGVLLASELPRSPRSSPPG